MKAVPSDYCNANNSRSSVEFPSMESIDDVFQRMNSTRFFASRLGLEKTIGSSIRDDSGFDIYSDIIAYKDFKSVSLSEKLDFDKVVRQLQFDAIWLVFVVVDVVVLLHRCSLFCHSVGAMLCGFEQRVTPVSVMSCHDETVRTSTQCNGTSICGQATAAALQYSKHSEHGQTDLETSSECVAFHEEFRYSSLLSGNHVERSGSQPETTNYARGMAVRTVTNPAKLIDYPKSPNGSTMYVRNFRTYPLLMRILCSALVLILLFVVLVRFEKIFSSFSCCSPLMAPAFQSLFSFNDYIRVAIWRDVTALLTRYKSQELSEFTYASTMIRQFNEGQSLLPCAVL